MSVDLDPPQYTPGNGYGHLGSLGITLVRTTGPSERCALNELGVGYDRGADEGLTAEGGEADCTNDGKGFAVLVNILVTLFVMVVVGGTSGTLAVTVMWIVLVCASELGRRPGSKMIGSSMPESTSASCMLDNVTADIVVMGTTAVAVDECADV